MSAKPQITVPAFDGSDSADAEDFIAAVREKAYLEGKQRDQTWILDLVSASLRRGALRWHTTLEPTIRKDWDLLEKALLARFCETFKGIDGVECENFIHSIRRRVLEEGRDGDNEWIARSVSTCVVGDALRWHASLAPEVRNDWELLQAAMLERYPPPEAREYLLKSPTIPLPASAAPAPPSLKTGVIRIVDSSNTNLVQYLSRTPISSGYLVATQTKTEALAVDYDPYTSSNTLHAKNFAGGYDQLGMQWYYVGTPILASTSSHFARIVGVSGSTSSINTVSYQAKGTVHSDVWVVSPDGSIKVVWTDANGVRTNLFPRGTDLIITGEASKYDQGYNRMNFVFEAA